MHDHQGRVQGLMVGVGAAFDYTAGNISRAPVDAETQSGVAVSADAGPQTAVQALFCHQHHLHFEANLRGK